MLENWKKTVEHESDVDGNLCVRYRSQKLDTGTGGLENEATSGDYPNYSIVEIGQNTEERSGDLRRVTFTKTPVENN